MTFDKEMEIIEKTLDLDMLRADRDFRYEMSMAVLTDQMDVFCFVESEDGSGAKNIFSRIIDAIIQFLHDVNASIRNLFAEDKSVDMAAYANSKTGKVQLAYDVQSVEKEVDERIMEGRKLVQAISSGTGISDEKVAAFVDKCKGGVQKYAGYVVGVAALSVVRKYVAEHAFKGADSWLSNLKNVCTAEEAKGHSIRNIRSMNAAKKTAASAEKAGKKVANEAKKQRQKQSIVNAIAGLCKSAGNARAAVAKQLHNMTKK